MTQEQKNRRGAGRIMADRYVRRVKADMKSLSAEDRRQVGRVLRMARDNRNARALVAMAHNAGVPGPLTVGGVL